jgi:hypothetical protein
VRSLGPCSLLLLAFFNALAFVPLLFPAIGTEHQRGGGNIITQQRLIEFALRDGLGELVAERILAAFL